MGLGLAAPSQPAAAGPATSPATSSASAPEYRPSGGVVLAASRRLPWPQSDEPITAVALAPDGRKVVAAGSEGTFRVWDLWTRGAWGGTDPDRTLAVMFSPTGAAVLIASRDGGRVLSAADGTPIAKFSANDLVAAGFSTMGKNVTCSDAAGVIRQFNIAGGTSPRPRTLKPADPIKPPFALTADGLTLLAPFRGGIVAIDLSAAQQVIRPTDNLGDWNNCPLKPSAALGVVVWCIHNSAGILELDTGQEVMRATGGRDKTTGDAVLSADGRRLVVAFGDDIAVYDAVIGLRLGSLATESPANCLAISNDGKLVAAGCDDGAVRIWEVGKLQPRVLKRPEDLARLWDDLADKDAAYRATWTLIDAGAEAVKLLTSRLAPGEGTVPATSPAVGSQDVMRLARAIRVLERIGTPDARTALRAAAGGPAAHPLTLYAKHALARLATATTAPAD